MTSLGPKHTLRGVEVFAGFSFNRPLEANVEHTLELFGVLVLEQRPGCLGCALDVVSGLSVHPCALLLNQDLLAGTDELQALLLQATQGLVELLFGLDAAREVAGSGDPDDAVAVGRFEACPRSRVDSRPKHAAKSERRSGMTIDAVPSVVALETSGPDTRACWSSLSCSHPGVPRSFFVASSYAAALPRAASSCRRLYSCSRARAC